MTNRTAETAPLIYVRVLWFLYLIMFIIGIFAEFFVRSSLIVSGDALCHSIVRTLSSTIRVGEVYLSTETCA
jgi:hypothetical protein